MIESSLRPTNFNSVRGNPLAREGETRWRSADGKRLYKWDSLHGHFEVYNKRGRHVGVVDASGVFVGEAVPGT